VTSPITWAEWSGVLWDLDGVITATAEIHQRAWADLFAPWGFTAKDYVTHVDGRPRYDGVRAFLYSRGIHLPEGDPTDAPSSDTICGFGNRKNQLFQQILASEGARAYPGTLAVITQCAQLGLAQAVVSSSRNARQVLAAAGLGEHFAVIVDGVTAVEQGLAGKPAPDMYLHAAAELGVPIQRCVVVEDAVSGVASGVAAGAGLVLGVDRENQREDLLSAGADFVVNDLEEIAHEVHLPDPQVPPVTEKE
jgi:beta-phosphoglucomutase family hydrolase